MSKKLVFTPEACQSCGHAGSFTVDLTWFYAAGPTEPSDNEVDAVDATCAACEKTTKLVVIIDERATA